LSSFSRIVAVYQKEPEHKTAGDARRGSTFKVQGEEGTLNFEP
jgi:hypothetical protein